MTGADQSGQDLRRLALGCLLPSFQGPTPPPWLLRSLRDGLGGVVLFASNTGDGTRLGELTDRLRTAAGRDVVIALDEEGGEVTRLDAAHGSAVPTAAALGQLDDPETTRTVAAWTGARLAAAGVTLDLAPVADVNSPGNPVIGLRSFGSDPDLVTRHVVAAVVGLQDAGIRACVKHFPGHGDTLTDSHVGVATVARDTGALHAVDLVPFRAAIDAGVAAVMTGHLLVPALDPVSLVTLSAVVTRALLRGELGFTGTVVTDALEMGALVDTAGMVGGAVGALLAGADTLETGAVEDPGAVDAIVAGVLAAVAAGRLDAADLARSADRTAALGRPAPRSAAGTAGPVPAAVRTAAARALEVLGSPPRLVTTLLAPLVLECHSPASVAAGPTAWTFGPRLAAALPGTTTVVLEDDRPLDVRALAGGRPVVLVVRDVARHPWQQRLLAQLVPRDDGVVDEVVVVDVGWPWDPTGVTTVRTRGTAPAQLAAAADVLLGRT